MPMTDQNRVTATRIVEALLIAGITAGISVYAAVQTTARDVEHLAQSARDLATEVRELRREMRPLYSLEALVHRVGTAEDRIKNIASRVRDLEKASPRSAGQ